MLGCCGMITNPPHQFFIYKFLFNIFHCGIFRDILVNLYGNFKNQSNYLINSNMLSGGLSAWRAEVFDVIKFDVKNHFHMFEDIDFSTRAEEYFGPRFYINLKARLAHNCSPINRATLGELQRRKLTEFIIYYKKRRHLPNATIAFLWLLLGMMFEAIVKSFLGLSISPIKGYFFGVKQGLLTKLAY
jgi:GT2 family glycosyltransferase